MWYLKITPKCWRSRTLLYKKHALIPAWIVSRLQTFRLMHRHNYYFFSKCLSNWGRKEKPPQTPLRSLLLSLWPDEHVQGPGCSQCGGTRRALSHQSHDVRNTPSAAGLPGDLFVSSGSVKAVYTNIINDLLAWVLTEQQEMHPLSQGNTSPKCQVPEENCVLS